MIKKLFLGVVGVLALLVAFVVLSLRASPSSERFELQPVAPAADAAPVLIFGGTRGTGLEVARLLSERGETVTAFVRPGSDRSALEALGARFVEGDAMNPADVEAALAAGPYRAVVTTIGCLRCEPPPDFIGNRNIVDAAARAGVDRVVLITSIGAGNSADAAPLLSRFVLRRILPLKTQAETHLRESGLDYTIIRPGGLSDAPPTGNGYLSEDPDAFGFIYRADLAQLIVASLDDDRTIGKTFAAADANRVSPWSR